MGLHLVLAYPSALGTAAQRNLLFLSDSQLLSCFVSRVEIIVYWRRDCRYYVIFSAKIALFLRFKQKSKFIKMSDFDRKIITDAITRMLARREHSVNEIARKLQQKGIASEAFTPILDEFKDAGIQSDTRFAESRARALYMKGKGPRVIKLDLQQYGVDEGTAEQALNEIEADWFESARNVKVKKFGEFYETEFALRQKQKQFLQYRGFYQDHIDYAVSESSCEN